MSTVVELKLAVYEDAFGNVVNAVDTYTYLEIGSSRETGFKVECPVSEAIKDARDFHNNYNGCEVLGVVAIDTQSPEWTDDHKRNINWLDA